jgi:hypothetical protein
VRAAYLKINVWQEQYLEIPMKSHHQLLLCYSSKRRQPIRVEIPKLIRTVCTRVQLQREKTSERDAPLRRNNLQKMLTFPSLRKGMWPRQKHHSTHAEYYLTLDAIKLAWHAIIAGRRRLLSRPPAPRINSIRGQA